MTRYYINGIEFHLSGQAFPDLGGLVTHVRSRCAPDDGMLTGIWINGVALDDVDQAAKEPLPLSVIESVEFEVRSPDTIAEETIDSLDEFVRGLQGLCTKAEQPGCFHRLVEGTGILVDSATEVRKILNAGPMPELDTLEKQLVPLLRTLLTLLNSGVSVKVVAASEVLRTQLPDHLDLWRSSGIPALRGLFSKPLRHSAQFGSKSGLS